MSKLRLIVVDPGHFHAALALKEMHPDLSPEVRVYAPVGPDLADFLTRIARFNTRADAPTRWALDIHAGDDFVARLAAEPAGDAAIGLAALVVLLGDSSVNVRASASVGLLREMPDRAIPVIEEVQKTARGSSTSINAGFALRCYRAELERKT